MLDKLLSNGRNGRNCLQLNIARLLRAAASDIYSDTYAAHSSCYPLKYHRGSVLHMYEGVIKSSLIDRFSKGMMKRMSENPDR